MKPLQIGLLVLAGALGGALIMKFTQRPAPAPAPAARVTPAPVAPAPVAPAPAVETASAAPEPAKLEPAPPRRVHRPKPAHVSKPAPVTVARNEPPPAAESQAPPPQTNIPATFPEPVPAPPPPSEPSRSPILRPEPAEEAPPAPTPAPVVTLRAGTLLPVRLGEALSSERNQPGDTFTATLDAPLAADGFVIAERGARLEGKVVEVQKAGHVKGQALLGIELTRLDTSDGQHVAIQTGTFRKQAVKSTTEDVGIVAAAAGIGAIIGAIAGGGKGAGIGAAAGGAAGAGGVMAKRGKAASLPTETRVRFRLLEPVTLTEHVSR